MPVEREIGEFKDEGTVNKLKYIILWTNWRKTFLIFSPILIILVYLQFQPLITVISDLTLFFLSLSILRRAYIAYMGLFMNMDYYPSYLDMDLSISLTQADQWAISMTKYLQMFFTKIQSLVVRDKLRESLKVFAVLTLLSLIGDYIQFKNLLLAAWITLFTVPKLYDWQKPFIDVELENLKILRAVLKSVVLTQITIIKINCKNQWAQMWNESHEAQLDIPN